MIGLSRHIEILLLSNDCVIVPGFGGFMAHHVDARKDENDGSFLPPIRSIGFNPKLTLNDSLLAQSYVEAYDISYPDAVMRIEDEVRELREVMERDGSYEFEGIGTISLNEDGNLEFVPCEAGILSPSLYGLGSFEMKTLKELRQSLEASLENQSKETLTENVESELSEVKPRTEDETVHHSARIIALWRNVAVACIAAVIFLLIPSPLVNNAQMAGNQIDTKLLDRVVPKNITTGEANVVKAVSSAKSKEKVEKLVEEEQKQTEKESAEAEGRFSIVVASHVTIANANSYVKDLRERGYDDAFVHRNNHVKVLLGHYKTREEASEVLNSLNDKSEFTGAWITTVNK